MRLCPTSGDEDVVRHGIQVTVLSACGGEGCGEGRSGVQAEADLESIGCVGDAAEASLLPDTDGVVLASQVVTSRPVVALHRACSPCEPLRETSLHYHRMDRKWHRTENRVKLMIMATTLMPALRTKQ